VITIRQAGEDDWDTLRQVRLRALQTDPKVFGSTYEREVAFDEVMWRSRTQTSAVFLAWDDEDVVGIVMGYADEEADEAVWELVAMWVAPEARSQGITPRLIQAVVSAARDDGAAILELWYSGGNDRASSVYERFGFVLTGDNGVSERDPSIVFYKMRLSL
jgi:GNAT superfamily N-acetyltransferase